MSGKRGEPTPAPYLNPDGTQRKKGKALGWRLRYTVPGRKPVNRVMYGTFREAVVEIDKLYKKDEAAGRQEGDPSQPFITWISGWVDRYRYLPNGQERPATTVKQHEQSLRYIKASMKKKKLEKRPLNRITRQDLTQILDNVVLLDGSSPSDSVMKACRLTLSMSLKSAVRQGIIAESPMPSKSWAVKQRHPDEDYAPTIQELEHVLTFLNKDWLADHYRFLFWTGLRIAEALSLRVDNVFLDEQRIEVRSRRTSSGGRSTEEGGLKTAAARREVPLLGEAIEPVMNLRMRAHKLGSDHLLVGSGRRASRIVGPNGKRQTTEKPEAVGYSTITAELREAVRKSGATPFTCHTLRHSFATTLLSAGVGEEDIARWLGHSSSEVTKRVYANVLHPVSMRAVASQVDEKLSQAQDKPLKGLETYLKVTQALSEET
jgi:integrase